MLFKSPHPTNSSSFNPPDFVPVSDFILSEDHGRHPLGKSRPPQMCGLTGKSYNIFEVRNRVEALAQALAEEMGWQPNKQTEWDKVAAIYSVNTIDYSTVTWAIHRLSGIVTPADSRLTVNELEYQLRTSGARCLFTSLPQMETSLAAAAKVGIPTNRIYLMSLAFEASDSQGGPLRLKTVDRLIYEGRGLPRLEKQTWEPGQGARQTAVLCFSSGTSGLPKGVMISHRNLIYQILQVDVVEKFRKLSKGIQGTENVLGLLPQSHIYAMSVATHAAVYRGDCVISLPRYRLPGLLEAIERFQISILYLAPPIILAMTNNIKTLSQYNLSSVTTLVTGGAALSPAITAQIGQYYPSWDVCQLYGVTETSGVICYTAANDIWVGSCGPLLPLIEARLVGPDGQEVEEYDHPGELLVRSPTNCLGYLNNGSANVETFPDGWVRTGDIVVFRTSKKGYDHLFVVDRLKELIKVNGLQVAPFELETLLLSHPAVTDAAVVPVPHFEAGELPKAFIVKSAKAGAGRENDESIKRDIHRHIEENKAKHKWLRGGIEFITSIPKNSSGKTLRRVLKEKARSDAREARTKL